MPDHLYYEELTALAAGGHLSPQEREELRAHLEGCEVCRRDAEAYQELVCSGLPLTRGAVSAASETASSSPEVGARDRFLARAAGEGIRVSREARIATAPRTGWSPRVRAAAGLAIAATLIAAFALPQLSRRFSSGAAAARQEIDRLTRENAQLGDRLTARDTELAAQQAQLRKLQTEVDAAARAETSLRRENQLQGVRLGQSTSREARLVDELQNRDEQLASASQEIDRINQLRVTDRAALDAQGVRLHEAFDQLRVATATIEVERQLAAAGKDILQLVLARQLRVVDVRDTDASGKPAAAFARVFVADGQTIRVFAFDLNEGSNGSRRFQVWGEHVGNPQTLRSLGTLDVDDRTQNRWGLTIQNAAAVKDINSVFVTASARGNAPEGPRLLYAFLGPDVTR